ALLGGRNDHGTKAANPLAPESRRRDANEARPPLSRKREQELERIGRASFGNHPSTCLSKRSNRLADKCRRVERSKPEIWAFSTRSFAVARVLRRRPQFALKPSQGIG